MDWADRIESIILYGGEERDTVRSIAAALRKAKADGYREGAASYEEYGTTKVWEEIEAYALKIEKGEE